MKLDAKAFGYSCAIVCSISTLVIGLLGKLAFVLDGKLKEGLLAVVEVTNPFYIFDLSTWLGLVLGGLEALVFWFLMGYLFVLLYNFFVK
tara:strand:- start:194 stop:463 length:270 start_codon:yes stop_codon:yes gene_type:complete